MNAATIFAVMEEYEMDVKDILVAAKQAVAHADIPEDLRLIAFEKAVDLIARTNMPADRGPQRTAAPPSTASTQNGSEDLISRVAERLKLDRELVSEVYHQENGEIHVAVATTKLDPSKTGGTKQLALLVAAGRQGAGLEEFTSSDKIREEAEDFRKYDSNNFARAIGDMGDDFAFRGTGRKKSLKLNRHGWEAAHDLVDALAGGDV